MNAEYEYFFSVITVCYNAESSIEKTIKSVLSQNNDDYEYLIIDGKSNDQTVAIAQKYHEKFCGRMRIVSETDQGIYDAMNKAIQMSKGHYLVFINADDELCEGVLNKIEAEIAGKNEAWPEIIYGDCLVIYENDDRISGKIRNAVNPINRKTLMKGMGLMHQSMFTSRKVFAHVGMFNIKYTIGADWDFLIRAVTSHVSLYYMPIPFSKFATDGVSSKVHNLQRHKIRKQNKLYRYIDTGLIRDIFHMKTMIQLIIGRNNYQKLRFFINKKGY